MREIFGKIKTLRRTFLKILIISDFFKKERANKDYTMESLILAQDER